MTHSTISPFDRVGYKGFSQFLVKNAGKKQRAQHPQTADFSAKIRMGHSAPAL
jgi:hypothetical protein